MRAYVHFYSQQWDSTRHSHVQAPCLLPQTVNSYLYFSCYVKKVLPPLGILYPLALTIFLSPAEFLRYGRQSIVWNILFTLGLKILSVSAHRLAEGAYFIPIYCRRKLLLWWLRKTLIYSCNRMSFGAMLLLFTFSRTVVFGFSLVPGLSRLLFFCLFCLFSFVVLLGRGVTWTVSEMDFISRPRS